MKKEKMKQRIFDSAKQIVKREGMSQLNVRKIAKLSDCSLGSIYNAFDNFSELQLHINADILSDLFLALSKVIENGTLAKKPMREIFKDLGFAYIEFGQKNTMLWKSVFEHFPQKEIPKWYKKRAQEGIYAICAKIADFFDLPEKEVKHMVGFYWTSIHGMSGILLNKKMEMVAELFKEDYLELYVEYCLNGLFKRETVSVT
ncbi:MAG: hypothetical protein K940chlam2_00767 [Chlamydiae bacterium]|nr:hypothetical protein [Chlamydiota bacterium]